MLLKGQTLYRFADFELQLSARVLLRDGQPVHLGSKAFEVLTVLVRAAGEIVTKEDLLKAVWPESFVEENNLAQHIVALRKALADRTDLIKTVPGRGYQFTGTILDEGPRSSAPTNGWKADQTDDPAVRDFRERTSVVVHPVMRSNAAAGQNLPSPQRRRWAFRFSVTLGLVLSAGAGYAVWRHTHRLTPRSFVVLSEVENETGDPKLDKVLDAALEIDLKQSPFLNVLSNADIQDTLARMQQPKSSPLSPAVAREVCLRNNAQVSLHGVLARLGQRYLLTLQAIDCQSGNEVAETKSEAKTADDIAQAIDTVAAAMRQKLGESRSSIQQYSVRLMPENTNSLEALERYSEAAELDRKGKFSEAIPLYRRAIEIDPKFAIAYANLANMYSSLGDHAQAKANLTKAYELRDSVDEQDRLFIVARYDEEVTGDLYDAAANYRLWTSIYPRSLIPWGNLASVYINLGQYPLAIEPARKALALNPHIAAAWVILAQALLQAGQIEEAKSICNQAIANNLAEGAIRSTLMKIAALQNDTAALQAQLDWAANSSGVSYIRVGSASLAFARGQAELGRQLIGELAAYYKQHGMANMGSFYLLASARQLADEGYAQDAKKLLDSIPLLPGMTDPLIALAEIGEPDRAADILKQELSQHPRGTLWLDYKGPQVRAAILLAEHKPQEAIAALERSRALDHRGYDVLYLRGNAYLAAGQPVLAAQQFRDILDHPSIDPLDYQYPLARLGLARAYAMSGSKPEARTEYAKLFAAWKNADPDLPVLKQARAEYAHL